MRPVGARRLSLETPTLGLLTLAAIGILDLLALLDDWPGMTIGRDHDHAGGPIALHSQRDKPYGTQTGAGPASREPPNAGMRFALPGSADIYQNLIKMLALKYGLDYSASG